MNKGHVDEHKPIVAIHGTKILQSYQMALRYCKKKEEVVCIHTSIFTQNFSSQLYTAQAMNTQLNDPEFVLSVQATCQAKHMLITHQI